MRRILAVAVAMTALTTPGETIWIDGVQWTYVVKDEGVQIGTGELYATAIPRDTMGAIAVPAEIDGRPVVEIASYAFDWLQYVYQIDIPDSVSTIGYQAFAWCKNLESVLLPDGVSIGGNAFIDSDKIQYPVFSKTGKSLYAFSSDRTTSPATSYVVPDGVEFIGNHAFGSAGNMTSLSLPNSLRRIGEYAFSCSFEDVAIPSSVTNIGECAFSSCRNLCSIVLPETLESINGATFWCCYSLTNVVIPNSVTMIGPSAFSRCSSLESISIPASVTNIGCSAFSECPRLLSIEIDPGNESYKTDGLILFSKDGSELNAFLELQSQTYDIPASVRNIEDYAFDGCSNLTELAIPNSVTNIGRGAFYGCSGLTSITIPDSVTSIGDYAFQGSSGMTTLSLPRSFRGKTANMGIPFGCEVAFFGPCSLWIESEYGRSRPESGMHDEMDGDIIECCISGFDDAGHVEGVRYVCAGWRGTGSVPASGTGTNVTFTIMEDSSITWLWETNVWLDCSLSVDGRETNIVDWIPVSDSSFVIPVELLSETLCVTLSGETNGIVVNATAGTVSVPVDGPRTVSIRIESITDTRSVKTEGKPVVFAESAGRGWFPVADESAADGFCLRSGEIEASETSTTETMLVGPGTLSFKWKIPAGRGDYARMYLDGVKQEEIDREEDWVEKSINIPSGEHVVRWSYERGSGSAFGEDAAFLDDVDWRPQVSLAVANAFGTASPGAGTHTLVYGDEVAASVAEPEPAGGTRCVCTGWTGTGSAPASGEGTNIAFRIEGDSSIAWNWRTDHWIDVAVSGAGATDFAPRWVAEGETVMVTVEPATHLYSISLGGDTNGVTLAGTTLSIPADGPHTILVAVEEVKVALLIESAHGESVPTNGVHWLSWGTDVAATIEEPEPSDGIRYVCTGWTGTGSAPASGEGTNVAFRIEEDSSVAWTWATNVWIAVEASGPVEADFTEGWIARGSNVVVRWAPTVPYFTIALAGDTDGAVLDEEARMLAIPADRPRSVTLVAKELTLAGALDGQGLRWTTDGAAPWFPQIAVTHDGEDAAKSGCVLGDGTSALEVALEGGGTFAWSWRIDAAGNVGVDVFLDAKRIRNIAPGADWARETLAIEGDGPHTVRFEFWNEGTSVTLKDCAYLDEVSWTGEVPGGRTTLESEVPVPFVWLDEYNLVEGGDYEAASVAAASNGVNKVWECYVAGLSPTNAAARFEARIVFDADGKPVVKWTPDLNEGGTKHERVYTVIGKTNLTDKAWGPTNEATRFFRVKVQMPE